MASLPIWCCGLSSGWEARVPHTWPVGTVLCRTSRRMRLHSKARESIWGWELHLRSLRQTYFCKWAPSPPPLHPSTLLQSSRISALLFVMGDPCVWGWRRERGILHSYWVGRCSHPLCGERCFTCEGEQVIQKRSENQGSASYALE